MSETEEMPNGQTGEAHTHRRASSAASSRCPAPFLARDIEGAVALDDLGPAERKQPCGGLRQPTDPELHEDALRASLHSAGVEVVAGAVPGAYQLTSSVDRALGQVGAQVMAVASDGEVLVAGVSHCPAAD